MKNEQIIELLVAILGKQTSYRLGRALYQQARGDIQNNIATNGERMIQRCVINAWRKKVIKDSQLVVFDVGANIGEWSYQLLDDLLKSNELQFLDIYLFEPVPSTAEKLIQRLNKFGDLLRFEQLVLSSTDGIDQFYINCNNENAGTNSLYQQGIDSYTINVLKNTASTFCAANKINKIHLFKCDTEGHDMEVIRGAIPLIAEEKIDVFQFEYNYRWIYSKNFLRDVFSIIEKLPYKIAKIQSEYIILLPEWHFELDKFFEGNYLLVHKDSVRWFPAKTAAFDRYNTQCLNV